MKMLIHELVARHAAENPLKTAFWDDRGEMRYGEMAASSAAIARALADTGLRPGQAAAVYVPYSGDLVLGAISVLRAGGVFIPFDEAYPVERMDYVLGDSEAAAIVTVRALWNRKPLHFPEEKVVFIDEQSAAGEGFACPETLTPDSPAMLLYTSGTTGRPKGVLHTHKLLTNTMDWMNIHGDVSMDENARVGVISGLTFMGTELFLFGGLEKGGTLYFAPEAARNDLGLLYRFFREKGITHAFVPAGIAVILAEDYDIRGLTAVTAGEKLRSFKAHNPENCLINLYGSTETGGVMSRKVFGGEEHICVGKPYTSTRAQIVDEEFRPVAPGETGELLIDCDFMARQYWKLPELTAEKWVALGGTVWFRTGDRARCSPEGDYDILGRTDNMVKLRGFRIETGEVEVQVANAVSRLGRSDVGQIAVVLRTVGGMDHLACYYEAARELDEKAVKEEVSRYLTEYMVPDIWVRMDALPRNANGKVMRGELPQPKRDQHIPGTLDSEVVARVVWTAADVLGIDEQIGPDDRFTDLGGTSLTAMKYAMLLREQGIRISSTQILKLNGLRSIAEAADVAYEQLWSQKEYEGVLADFASRGEHIQKVLPISPKQDEMLFEQIIHPDWSSLRIEMLLQIDSLVSEQDLRRALDAVAQEHEELRAAMVFHHVTVIQQVITDRKIPLEMIDLQAFGEREIAEMWNRLLHVPMDLQKDSLMKVVCVHTAQESYLFFMTHRIAFEKARFRGYLAQMMRILEKKYPNDRSIQDWREVLEMPLPSEHGAKRSTAEIAKKTVSKREAPPEICVYSENKGPKLVFVHTGNTGSAAYYRLAAQIGDQVSFAVIEPFNLYHMEEARYGIRNIAAKYIEILKSYQPEGPYLLGGWCYGGVVAHEMACQLEQAGEDVRLVILLDSHATTNEQLREMSKGMTADINRTYFETSPLFAELRESGMLEALIQNAVHVNEDMVNHVPSFFHGDVLYFKPDRIPSDASEAGRRYWKKMMEFEAGNYEHYCNREKLRIVHTPHEHDLMMDDASLAIIVPELMEAVKKVMRDGEARP